MIPSLVRRAALRLQSLLRAFARPRHVEYAALLEAAPAPIAITDTRGVLLEVNAAWERLTGRRRAEVIGHAASAFGLPASLADVESEPGRFVRPDGRAVDVLVSARAVQVQGERRRVCSWLDATGRRESEDALRELEQANRELESYNYSLSHDLRQPLAAIAGFADLLLEQCDPESDSLTLTCAREIDASAARMNQIIESLRRLADSGRAALNLTEVDVAGQVAGVLEELSVAAPVGAVKVGSLPPVHADPVLLRQVWVNLIDNALKYSRHSAEPRVEISGERRPGAVEYIVRDNGVGFDMRDAARLFTAFQRLAPSEGYEGHGIGLAIVQRIVRRHGGQISAESAPGKGATFRLTLPERGAR